MNACLCWKIEIRFVIAFNDSVFNCRCFPKYQSKSYSGKMRFDEAMFDVVFAESREREIDGFSIFTLQ